MPHVFRLTAILTLLGIAFASALIWATSESGAHFMSTELKATMAEHEQSLKERRAEGNEQIHRFAALDATAPELVSFAKPHPIEEPAKKKATKRKAAPKKKATKKKATKKKATKKKATKKKATKKKATKKKATKKATKKASKKKAAKKAKAVIETFLPNVVIASDDNASKYLIQSYYKNADLPFFMDSSSLSIL